MRLYKQIRNIVASCMFLSLILTPPNSVVASTTCVGVATSYFACPDGNSNPSTSDESQFWVVFQTVLDIITGLIGLVAVGGIAYGAVLYASARDSEQQTQQAKTIIRDVVIGLAVYTALYSLLQYLLPGGIF